MSKNLKKDKRYFENKKDTCTPFNSTWNKNFCSYLAGLIEGDGSIIVPKTERSIKGRLNYPSIQISFDSRDLALALIIQKTLGFGSISKAKGVNAYRYTVNDYSGLLSLVNMLNGNFRTIKINDFNLLINYLNYRFSHEKQNLICMDLDKTPLDKNAWLSGFIDADGCFFVNINKSSISCSFSLVQAIEDKKGNDKKELMNKLATFLNIPLKLVDKKQYGKKQYVVKANTLESNLILCSYLNEYSLFSSKYLNFKDFYQVLTLIKNKKHKTEESKQSIYCIKNSMNTKRTVFVWDHLQNFYNLYK